MTDIFVRRGGMPPPRHTRRRALLAVLVVVAVTAAVILALKHRAGVLQTPGGAGDMPAGHTDAAGTAGAGTPTGTAGTPGAAAAGGTTAGTATRTPSAADTDRAAGLFQQARKEVEAGQLNAARDLAYQALALNISPTLRRAVEDLLGDVNIQLAFSPRPMAEKQEYVVQAGDSLGALAKRFSTTVELIRKGNHISGSLIRVGDRLRILTGTFKIDVDVTAHALTLTLNDRFFKRYAVGTGKYDKTPTGTSKITDRIAQPTWWRPDGRAIPYGDKENVLGTHWLSLDIRGYGIHGTWEPDTVGKSESAGCVRLRNSDIEELYTLVPVGTEVVLRK